MPQPVVRIEGLSKRYRLGQRERYYTLRDAIANLLRRRTKPASREFWALQDINLDINQGEVVGIIGRNGAGKSTLLKVLAQITPPTTGQITLRGRVASLLEVGTGFHPELTGRDNIYLSGAILGMTRQEIRTKFNDIVEFSEIGKFLDTAVKHYSSGMYVRLAFAVAAHLESEILLVDEVLAVGDAQFQKKCLGKMDDIGKSGRTVIFVSHNMHSIRSLCSRAILLDKGIKVADGPVAAVINRYESYHTKGEAKVNWGENKPTLSHTNLVEAGILSDGQQVISEAPMEKPIQVYISFMVNQPVKVGTTILLHNREGQLMFFSLSNHESEWHMKDRPPGRYRSTCEIPANLLSPGHYSISIGLWEGFYDTGLMERDILHFVVTEGGWLRGDVPYASEHGLISPLLKWSSGPEREYHE